MTLTISENLCKNSFPAAFKGLSVDVALDEIEKNAGTQFDPRARAFVDLMRARATAEEAPRPLARAA